jgi:hypothetical protein
MSANGMRIVLSRTKDGVIFQIKASDFVENFMRSLGNGTLEEVELSGTAWGPLTQTSLKVYNASPESLTTMESQVRYQLSAPGSKLISGANYDGQVFYNLSFLRLVGISSPDGVRFLLRNTVLNHEGLLDLRDKLTQLCKQFHTDFIRPIEAEGYIYQSTTQENLI